MLLGATQPDTSISTARISSEIFGLAAQRNTTILLVEDNPDHALLVTRLIRKALGPVHVMSASRLEQGLSLVRQTHCQLIVADLGLPDTVGIEVVEVLHRACPHIPIIVLSGNSDEQVATKSVQSGAEDYLLKDEISERTLRRSIRYALERQSEKEKLAKLALYDSLTGLINRNAFNEHLGKALSRSNRQPGQLVLMFIDLDHFKDVNDSFGHGAGDLLLVEVGKRIKCSVRESDLVARLGGDEFGVILENVTNEEECSQIAERILETLATSLVIDAHSVAISASIGITSATGTADTVEQIIQRADAAMYQAKEAGRNQSRFFDKALHARQQMRRQCEKAIKEAVETQAFELHYQPQYCLQSHRIIGAEALLRWCHPQQGVIPSSQFIHALEEQRLISHVGKWTFSSACSSARIWKDFRWPLRLAINVSPVQFADPDFVKHIERACKSHNVEPSCFQFEVSESALMSNIIQYKDTLKPLKALGISIAVDGFGSGYLSLTHLRELPVSTVKIDPVFVRAERGVDEPMVSAIVALGHSLGFEVVANGVETQDQADTLKRLGCNSAQGVWKCAPLRATELQKWLQQHFSTLSPKSD